MQRKPAAKSEPARYSVRQNVREYLDSRQGLVWGITTLLVVLACASVGAYMKEYMERDFIGQRTRLLYECRKNPKVKREPCEKLLIDRGELSQPRNANTLRGPQKPPFLLYESDADLTPAPM